MKKIMYLLFIFLFSGCISISIATKSSIDKAIKKEEIDFLEKIVKKEIKIEDEKLLSYVKENLIILKKKKAKNNLEKAIKNKDIKLLKSIVEDKESLLSLEDKKVALTKLKEFITEKLLEKINMAFNRSDIDEVEKILQSEDAKYFSNEEKLKITYKVKAIKRERIFEKIKKAMDDVDLQKIYEILNSKEAEYLTISDKDLANKYLNQYLKPDGYINSYKQRKMEQKVRKIPEEITENIFINPEKYVENLVKFLIDKEDNPFIKIKLIHDWICDNISYDVEMFLSGNIRDQDYINVLKKKKGVCSGYANLFLEMANLANFKDCIIITGNIKRENYNKFDYATAHDWNAVKIGNKWYLIDCTLDAGNVSGPAFYFNKKYSTAYLFISPRANLYTHFPDNPKYQFYAPVINKETFLEEPYIFGTFFDYGLDIIEGKIRQNNSITDKGFSFLLKSYNSNSTSIIVRLRDIYGNNLDDKITLTKIDTTTYKVDCNLKKGEKAKVDIYAKRIIDKNFEDPIDIHKFESIIIPKINRLLEDNKITKEEKEIFLNSFTKVEKNSLFYYNEDLFDIKKINIVTKIMQLMGDTLNWHPNVLSFVIE